jgi:tetratricopeptide (TPR) repeat protein
MIEGYGKRALSAAELMSVDRHIAACEACRAGLRQASQADESAASLFAGLHREAQQPLAHLSYEELDAYVNQALDEAQREIVASHLHICSSCEEEAKDLLAFQVSLEAESDLPAMAAPASSPGLFERLKSFLQVPAYRMAFQTAALCLFAAIAILFLSLPLKRQAEELQAQLHQLQQENAELRKRSDGLAELQAQLETLRQENEALLSSQPADELPDNLLVLKDAGGTISLDAEGKLQGLAGLSSASQQLIKNALRSGRVMLPTTISEVTAKAGVLMSSASAGVSFALQSPVGSFVQSSRPVFRWREMKGATSYVVTVYDAAFRVIARSEEVERTEWTPARELERGITLRWQVTANLNGRQLKSPVPPAPEARFKVIELAKAEELQRTRQRFADAHLALGILYAEAGLLDDAERELQILLRANPQADAVRRLLQSVKARRR